MYVYLLKGVNKIFLSINFKFHFVQLNSIFRNYKVNKLINIKNLKYMSKKLLFHKVIFSKYIHFILTY